MKAADPSPPNENSAFVPAAISPPPVSRRRFWLLRVAFAIVWLAVVATLSPPFDNWLLIATALAFGLWIYNRLSERTRMPPLRVEFERVEKITLTHVLLALLLLLLIANHSELVKLKETTDDVQSSVVDLQNSTSDKADEIKSSLEDVSGAIQASQ